MFKKGIKEMMGMIRTSYTELLILGIFWVNGKVFSSSEETLGRFLDSFRVGLGH